jgi:hypothetical protein
MAGKLQFCFQSITSKAKKERLRNAVSRVDLPVLKLHPAGCASAFSADATWPPG